MENPPVPGKYETISYRGLSRVKLGWYVDRRSGSHVIMRNENKKQIRLVIPIHGKSVKPGTLGNILKHAQISVEELKELL